jgi:hypothetical protein
VNKHKVGKNAEFTGPVLYIHTAQDGRKHPQLGENHLHSEEEGKGK